MNQEHTDAEHRQQYLQAWEHLFTMAGLGEEVVPLGPEHYPERWDQPWAWAAPMKDWARTMVTSVELRAIPRPQAGEVFVVWKVTFPSGTVVYQRVGVLFRVDGFYWNVRMEEPRPLES